MAISTDMSNMHLTIQDALDELCAPRVHRTDRERALTTLEELLVAACVPGHSTRLTAFLALQDIFECNIPSRVISWLTAITPRLEALLHKSAKEGARDADAAVLGKHATQALLLVQGIALTHASSKRWLSRRYPLQILLDLLLVSRHLPPPPETSQHTSRSVSGGRESLENNTPPTSLSSAVVDTLLCVLVDSTPGIRAFEDANGCQVVVKILKRAGTPREVRMKCLEFLTFYLMDETSTRPQPSQSSPSLVRTAPNSPRALTPTSWQQPSISRTISSTPSHSHTRSLASISSKERTASSSSESGSAGTSSSSNSFTSKSSATSVESYTSAESSPTPTRSRHGGKPRSSLPATPHMEHLKRSLDLTPQTPMRKPGVNGDAPRMPGSRNHNRGQSLGTDLSSQPQPPRGTLPETPLTIDAFGSPVTSPVSTPVAGPGQRIRGLTLSSIASSSVSSTGSASSRMSEDIVRPMGSGFSAGSTELRTTEEKKALLGSMLANVDALVEGVRKAGIWGLA